MSANMKRDEKFTGVKVVTPKTKRVQLNTWDMLAIEEALSTNLPHIDPESLQGLRRKVSAAISGSLVVPVDFH